MSGLNTNTFVDIVLAVVCGMALGQCLDSATDMPFRRGHEDFTGVESKLSENVGIQRVQDARTGTCWLLLSNGLEPVSLTAAPCVSSQEVPSAKQGATP